MKAKYKPGDILEFRDRIGTLVDRVDSVYISGFEGIQYFFEQYDGYKEEDEVMRVVESADGLPCETWEARYKEGQLVAYTYCNREESSVISDVEWCFNKRRRIIQYFLNNSHLLAEEEVCASDTSFTNLPQAPLGTLLKDQSENSLPASERGPRLVKSTE